MKPTMKLRWTFKPSIFQRNNESPIETKVQVLQQWWEGKKLKEEYEKLPPGTVIPFDTASPPVIYEYCGEWRDIPVEEQ